MCGPSMVSSCIRKSLCINYVFWLPSCMQAWLRHSINTNSNFLRVSINGAWERYFISNSCPIFQIQKYSGKAGLPNIQSMVMKSCLWWVGHIVRMDDGCLPRQLFYGEMWEGKRSALKPKKRFKDTIKYYLKQSGLPVDQWEKMASDRNKWQSVIHESVESFENIRMQYSDYKRLIRKGKQGPAPGPQSRHANCNICGRLCLSLASL